LTVIPLGLVVNSRKRLRLDFAGRRLDGNAPSLGVAASLAGAMTRLRMPKGLPPTAYMLSWTLVQSQAVVQIVGSARDLYHSQRQHLPLRLKGFGGILRPLLGWS
jgi:hypothetical protein